MGFMGGLMGNASKVDTGDLAEEFGPLLGEGEVMEHAYKLTRDVFIFTNRRFIFVDKQGITGKKTSYLSVPYTKISSFAVETAGALDLDAELKIWISGFGGGTSASPTMIQAQFTKNVNIYEVQALLAHYTCG